VNLCVKICGLTRAGDVEQAVAAGADAVGFVLYERSPRHVPVERLAELACRVPAGVLRVGVVVNAPAEQVLRAVAAGGLHAIQFHGDEPDALVAGFAAARAWRAVGLRSEADVEAALRSPAERLVIDAVGAAGRGGTGQVCNWGLAAALARRRPALLAGGLRPENVAEAVRQVRPWGVDVSSGVEITPGVKDAQRLRDFIAAARAAASATEPWVS
jgi:phosphoribosylanthranilate isomerase